MPRKPRAKGGKPGVISRHEIYTLDEIEERLRVTGWTLREAFRAGLKSCRFGRIKVVRGEDFDEFCRRSADQNGQPGTSGKN